MAVGDAHDDLTEPEDPQRQAKRVGRLEGVYDLHIRKYGPRRRPVLCSRRG